MSGVKVQRDGVVMTVADEAAAANLATAHWTRVESKPAPKKRSTSNNK